MGSRKCKRLFDESLRCGKLLQIESVEKKCNHVFKWHLVHAYLCTSKNTMMQMYKEIQSD